MTDQTQPVSDTDEMDAHVMAVIEACGGDPKLAIRALLAEQEILEQRIGRLASALSFGYVRGRTGVSRPDPARPWCLRHGQRSTETPAQPGGSDPMRHGQSRRSHRVVTREIADRLLESLRPTRHFLTRSLADIPIGAPEYRQIDRVVQEIDGLAKILIGDETHYHQKVHSVPVPDTGNGGE
jgi:hypothetical protein